MRQYFRRDTRPFHECNGAPTTRSARCARFDERMRPIDAVHTRHKDNGHGLDMRKPKKEPASDSCKPIKENETTKFTLHTPERQGLR